ncbi:hypothetical protein SFR_2640 [Streptomyces sp. FR-008]|nr:hypothetical protein SFR_2640 [Streptomyces sp. FR-008]
MTHQRLPLFTDISARQCWPTFLPLEQLGAPKRSSPCSQGRTAP